MIAMTGREDPSELVVRFNDRSLSSALELTGDLFKAPPDGYRGERISISRARGTRGRRIGCTVILYHSQPHYPALLPEAFEEWWDRQGEYE